MNASSSCLFFFLKKSLFSLSLAPPCPQLPHHPEQSAGGEVAWLAEWDLLLHGFRLRPGLQLPLVILSDEPLDVGQLAVQVLTAVLLLAVVGVGLFDFSIFLQNLPTSSLVLLGALGELPELGIELREAPCDLLNAGMQVSVLAILGVEVILVALALL